MKQIFCLTIFSSPAVSALAQNVGIGTMSPNSTALLHVNLGTSTNKGLLITGTYNSSATVPDMGAGSRLMFYPGKGALRAGSVLGINWNNAYVGYSFIAIGYNTTANSDFSVAMGSATVANGSYATALCSNTTASGNYSYATGSGTIASAYSSAAIGNTTVASGVDVLPCR